MRRQNGISVPNRHTQTLLPNHPTTTAPSPSSSEREHFKLNRTADLFSYLQYNYLISPPCLLLVFSVSYYLITHFLLFRTTIAYDAWWTPDVWLCLAIGIPGQLAAVIPFGNLFVTMLPLRPARLQNAPQIRSFRTLRVLLVTRGKNLQTVLHTMANWRELRLIDERVAFHVVLDGDPAVPALMEGKPEFVDVIGVPTSFRPKHALFKARALEYASLRFELDDDDWVLHLDEETVIDAYALTASIEFIERTKACIGNGIILYNSRHHWKSIFLTVGEITRINADSGRFRFIMDLCRRPLLGYIHGSFILIKGEVEDACTWDTACLAEDFWFGLEAVKRGFQFGQIDAIAREQPPQTLRDVFYQRKRWCAGIWSTRNRLARLAYIGAVTFYLSIGYTWYILLVREEKLLVPHWIILWGTLCLTEGIWMTSTATIIQDLDAGGIPPWTIAWHVSVALVLTLFFHAFENLAVFDAILRPPKGFHVVVKA